MVYYEESGIIELLTTYGKTIFSKVTKSMFEELFFCYRKLSLYLKGIRYDFVESGKIKLSRGFSFAYLGKNPEALSNSL